MFRADASGAVVDTAVLLVHPEQIPNCIILGRVIKISSSGDSLTVANVTGHIAATASPSDDLQTHSPTEAPGNRDMGNGLSSRLPVDDANY